MTPSIPPPTPVSPPPNPPMFGSATTGAAGQRIRQQASNSQGFAGTILGSGSPTNTGNKTLLGQ
jgi:hypothetical protein